MLQLSDYQCHKCKLIFEKTKIKPLEDWPKLVDCIMPECNGKAQRVYSDFGVDVVEGNYGNAKNNYETGFKGYQQGMFGNVHGTRVKSITKI